MGRKLWRATDEMTTRIEQLDGDENRAWDDYARAHPDASFYHVYKWRAFFRDFFDKETFYFAAFDSAGSVCGLLPLVRQKSLFFGDYLVSLPFFNYGGALADNEEVDRLLLESAAALARELGASHIEYRDMKRRPGMNCRQDKVSMRLQLPASYDELAKSIGSKRRSQIKRPLRENPEISIGGIELIDGFYEVFSRNMRDLGTPVYAKEMFVDILARFPDESTVVLIEVAGRPAAAAYLITSGEMTEIPWASTVAEFNAISINMLLYSEVLKWSIERGSKTFDFGRSTVDSGTYRFKKQWGAEPVQLNWHYWLAPGVPMPQLTPTNPKYYAAINAWKKLPLWTTKWLGPRIVKHLP